MLKLLAALVLQVWLEQSLHFLFYYFNLFVVGAIITIIIRLRIRVRVRVKAWARVMVRVHH